MNTNEVSIVASEWMLYVCSTRFTNPKQTI